MKRLNEIVVARCLSVWALLFGNWILSAGLAEAQETFPLLDAAILDDSAFRQWVAGAESAIPDVEPGKGGPTSVVWAKGRSLHFRGVTYGTGRDPGVRHLRIGFTQPIEVGSVLVSGGGTLSVLKAEASYPGDLADESLWVRASRLIGDQAGHDEVKAGAFALWSVPAGTKTRALRFSHEPEAGDRENAGTLGGVWINAGRAGNVAPQALVQSVARDDVSAKLVDETNNGTWGAWDNGEQGAALPVSAEHPEIITLTWTQPVRLNGLALLWAGFRSCDVEAFAGGDDVVPRDAPASSWRRVTTANGIESGYPLALAPHWIRFDHLTSTRAIRLRLTSPTKPSHPHVMDKIKDGKRVWLGEIMALSPVAKEAGLASLILPKQSEEPPPIPVKFTLPEAGVVTLVIDDAQNKRVRNLVSETPFPAGENIAWWDGSDDLLRDPEAAKHGVYHIPTRPVAPGTYKVRGLWHQPLKLRYEFSIYNAGKPAWETADKTGCWLTTHTPPTSVAVVPGSRTSDGKPLVFLGAFIAEGGHGLQWLHEDGTKIGGQGWIGGNWTGAPTIAVDLGPKANPDHLCYVGSSFEGELRLTAKTRSFADQPILKLKLGEEFDPRKMGAVAPEELAGFDGGDKNFLLGAIAARDGKLVCSLVRQNQLLVVDIKSGMIEKKIDVRNPRGLCFDTKGQLLVLTGRTLQRFPLNSEHPVPVISDGLKDPRHVAVDASGNVLVTDRGASHQVKVFSPDWKLIKTIGKPGEPSIGPYDALHLNNPNGVAVDTQGRVWVAEADNFPRRVSLWSAKGELLRAFFGPTEYGGGGTLDPQDSSRFYYKGMEFKLDWKTGTDRLVRVFSRPDPQLHAHYGHYSPDTPLYPAVAWDSVPSRIERESASQTQANPKTKTKTLGTESQATTGRRYFTSCYTHTPTNGDDVAFVWLDDEKQARLVAALGNAHSWHVLREPEFRSLWPSGSKPDEDNPKPESLASFAWTDANHDGRPQPAEVRFVNVRSRGITVLNDLSFVVSQFGGKNVRFTASINAAGWPSYDLSKPEDLGPAGGPQPSSGGNQSLTDPNGWTINTNAPEPFSPFSLGGKFKGEPRWSYPSPWPGLHASHEAAVPDRPGMVVGHTRLLGGWVTGKAGPMFCINGNMGNMYLISADGLFVSTLFHDIRLRPNWAAPMATRNMDVTNVSLHDENFWPSITQTSDGRIFIVDGARTSLVRVDGLDTLQRLPDSTVTITADDLQKARDWFAKAEAQRQQQRGTGVLTVPIRKTAPQVDGQLNDWPITTDWAFIDRRGTRANFNSDSRPYEVSAAVALTDTHFFAAWRTTEKNLLANNGETANALFKNGGCLDVMLATDPAAATDRTSPATGDQRLLITRVKDQTRALLYRAKVPGTKDPVAFSSPWRSIHIDVVEDMSQHVSLASDNTGNFEISIPLTALHWQPKPGVTYRADIGVLRGSNGQTTQRVYWSNKATAITADVPSEAELTPKLWGRWKVGASLPE